MSSSPKRELARYAPFALGGGALVIGLALGVGRGGDPTPTASGGSAATAAATASASAAGREASGGSGYSPDLSGDDVGELVVKTGEAANGIALVGGRIVWLESEGSKLQQVLPRGGKPELLFHSEDDDRFAGATTSGDDGVYWVVDSESGDSAPIYFVAPPRGKPRQVAEGGSPDLLMLVDGKLHWSDRGVLMRLDDEPVKLAERNKRICGLAGDTRALYWLEIDYQAGASGSHQLMALSGGAEAKRLELLKPARERGLLVLRGDALVWVQSAGTSSSLMERPLAAGPLKRLARVADVSALIAADGALYWAEAHRDESDKPLALLRRLAKNSSDPERLGRMSGVATALALGDEQLWVATSKGIAKLPLP